MREFSCSIISANTVSVIYYHADVSWSINSLDHHGQRKVFMASLLYNSRAFTPAGLHVGSGSLSLSFSLSLKDSQDLCISKVQVQRNKMGEQQEFLFQCNGPSSPYVTTDASLQVHK